GRGSKSVNPLARRADAVLGLSVPRMQPRPHHPRPQTIDDPGVFKQPTVAMTGAAPRSRLRRHWLIASVALLIGVYWILQTVHKGLFTPDPSGVTMITSTTP